jgi:hypothetical protein
MLNEMYDKSNKIWSPAGYIYLRSNPENCMKRISQRSRESEESIDKSYIQRLHDLHEASYFWGVSNGYPMVCVDVENKTVPEIAQNIYQIFTYMGVSPFNGKYIYTNQNQNTFAKHESIYPIFNENEDTTKQIHSFISPNLFASFKPKFSQPIDQQQTQQQYTKNQSESKSIASKLRDISKAANMRRKHVKSTETYHYKTKEDHPYRILKKTSTTTYENKLINQQEYEKAFTSTSEDDIERGSGEEYKSDMSRENSFEEVKVV